jgi:hypothetical protein
VLAMPLGASPNTVRQGAFMGLAVIVDICAIAALLALGGMGKKNASLTAEKQTPPLTNSPPVQAQNKKQQQQKAQPLTDDEQQLAARILAGEFGREIPVVRAIIEGASVPHSKVAKVMASLLDQNKVKREGKQFQLTQPAIV